MIVRMKVSVYSIAKNKWRLEMMIIRKLNIDLTNGRTTDQWSQLTID